MYWSLKTSCSVHNYKGGAGMHYQLMTKVRTDRTSRTGLTAWPTTSWNFLGGGPRQRTAISVSLHQEKNEDQHAGYACHENLLPVHQHGSFTPKTAEDYFQLFLLWQDHLHRKPHHWGGKGCGKFAFRWRGTCHSVNVAVSGTGAKPSARSTMTNNVDKLQFWYLSFIFTARVRTDLT